ncbi:MAG TPA: GTPase ObgE [Acidimicrobiales bacterium]|nr:GTPase ObgE [Acidimicrobiales bacterium]
MASFIDEAQLHVKAGDGGAGAVAFWREAHVSRGGPDGGDGGNGGDVYLEASTNVVSLLGFRDHPHRRADSGTHGSGAKRFGRSGKHAVVYVPEGTVVHTLDGAVLADLAVTGDRLLAAQGGRGGRGNARFLTNRLRAPGFAEQGEVGEERWLNLELKLLADVALVGFPNVGKSTLISRISAAKPKVADYPFTTLEPHLGVVRVGGRSDNGAEYTVADIPGLIEGASEGKGLGFQFLRHIERARVLVILIDLHAHSERPPKEQLGVLLEELRRYRPELLDRPRIVVGSRLDLATDPRSGPLSYNGELEISAVTGAGLDELTHRLAQMVVRMRTERPSRSTAPVLHRPVAEGFVIARSDNGFVVTGRDAIRAVALSDLTDVDALAHVHRRLKRLGVDRALAKAGARPGDAVTIGNLSFTYEREE